MNTYYDVVITFSNVRPKSHIKNLYMWTRTVICVHAWYSITVVTYHWNTWVMITRLLSSQPDILVADDKKMMSIKIDRSKTRSHFNQFAAYFEYFTSPTYKKHKFTRSITSTKKVISETSMFYVIVPSSTKGRLWWVVTCDSYIFRALLNWWIGYNSFKLQPTSNLLL